MDQLKELFQKLTLGQRIWLAVAAAAVIGGLLTLSHWNQERDFKPLFTGLSAEDAGAVLAKLHESGTEYRLADNGSMVLVPSARVAELRIQLAAAGLPKTGRIGFELFDKTNFGASEFAEQVNYHRAIEGELERSVMSIREVEQARVHITPAKDSLYTESRQAAKASVLVKLRTAAALSPQNVAAICQLTASAVEGLSPDMVSVIDTNGNLLNRARPNNSGDPADGSEAALDYRKSIEHDLQNKIGATLEPILGIDHFRAGVSAEVDLTSGEQSEEVFDPQKSVMVSSQRTDDGPALTSAAGVPGTASNLPVPPKPSTSASNFARHTENITYQSSRLVKLTKLPRGSVKRLSLSVLVDHTVRTEGSGATAKRIVEAPSPEKLKVIRDLVAAATGLDTNRGDQLVVEAFPFEATLTPEPSLTFETQPTPVAPQGVRLPPWLADFVQKRPKVAEGVGAGLLIAIIAGGWFLSRRAKKKKIAAEIATAAIEGSKTNALAQSPDQMQKQVEGQIAQHAADRTRQELEALMQLKTPQVSTKKTEILAKHIGTETKANPGAMAQVVRTWLNG